MKCADGVWFPASETHLVKMLGKVPKVNGRGAYQYHKLQAAMGLVKKRRCAIDVGMHVGLWAMHLAKMFKTVIGFEPVAEHIECLRLNMAGVNNYVVHNVALGSCRQSVGFNILEGSTGSTQVVDGGQGASMCRLDDFEFDAVDFIKIDVEGYEYFVVEGGENTIKTHKPVIILEQKGIRPGSSKSDYGKEQYAAKRLLESWGAKQKFEISGDHCMSWK